MNKQAGELQKSYSVATQEHNASQEALSLWREIDRLGLAAHIGELEVKGYTIVPPEKVANEQFIDGLRSALLDVAERRNKGIRPDPLKADSLYPEGFEYDRVDTIAANFGQRLTYLLLENPLFVEAAIHPVALTLATYMVGSKCALYDSLGLLKGPGGGDLTLHCDNVKIPAPFPTVPQVCNATWLLSDYSIDHGALAFVPGSHRHYRHPIAGEGLDDRVPVVAPAGSLVFWGGNTWHGAFGRQVSGLRMSLAMFYCRPAIFPQEDSRSYGTEDFFKQYPNNERLAHLVGKYNNFGWKEEGNQNEDTAYNFAQSWFD